MPDLNAYLAQMQADGNAPTLYMTAFTGTAVLTGEISATPTFPATALAYTTSTGSSSDVKRGMRIVIRTPGGLYKGETNIRYSGTISSTSLPIRELSRGEIDVESGDLVSVYDVFLLSDKLPVASSTFAPDNVTYSTQNGVVAPLVRSGGYWAGPLDAGQAYATVAFDGTSETVDEDSGATVTHSWSAPTATGTTSSTSTSPSFTFPAGEHLVTHTGTDASNSATWTQYLKVYVDTDPYEIQLEGFSTNEDTGPSATVRVLGSASIDDLPDGTLVILWHPDYVVPRAAVASRSHIFMTGFLRRDNSRLSAEENELTFEIVSPLARLAEMAGFSKVMIRKGSPAKWREVEGLTVRRAILLLLRYYCNVADIGFDIEYTADDQPWNRFYLNAATPYEQVNELIKGSAGRFVIDRTGRLMLQSKFQYLDLSDRPSETNILALTDDDVLDLDASREHVDTVQEVEVQGFIADASNPTPYIARWPGTPGRGSTKTVEQRMIGATAAVIKRWAGMFGAEANKTYTDADGVKHRAPTVTLTLRGSYDVFDWYSGFIEIDLDETTNPRGIDFSALRFIFTGADVSIDPDAGELATTLRLQAETAARPGVKHNPKQVQAPTPAPVLQDFQFDLGTLPTFESVSLVEVIGSDGTLGVAGLLVLGSGGTVALARDSDGLSTSPTFVDISTGLTGTAGYWLQVDPFNFRRFYGAFSNGLWVCHDIFAVTPTWTQVLTNSRLDSMAHFYHHLTMTPYRQGMIVLSAGRNHADVTYNYGSSWATVNASAGVDARTSTGLLRERLVIEPAWHQGSGVFWAGIHMSGAVNMIRKSSNWAASFPTAYTTTGPTTSEDATRVYPPFLRAAGGNNFPDGSHEIIALSGSIVGGSKFAGNLYTGAGGGGTLTTRIDAATEVYGAHPTPGVRMIHGYEDSGLRFALVERQSALPATGSRITQTIDGFATRVVLTNQPNFGGLTGSDEINITGLPRGNYDWLMVYGNDGSSGILQVTTDGGDTAWIDALGNLASVLGDTQIAYAQVV